MMIRCYILMLFLGVVLVGCQTVNVIPQVGNLRTTIAYAKSVQKATQMAEEKAVRVCLVDGGKYERVDLTSTYQGEDKEQQALVKLASTILPKDRVSDYQEKYNYRVSLTFRCS